MGKYVDRDGFVWEGAVHQCFECSYWEKEKERCTKFWIGTQEVRKKLGVDYLSQNNCDQWRPGN